MAYNELIKNFENIRDYMRQFYVYGFKSRNEFDRKSARSYDNERRRIESWLGDYMSFRQDSDGKKVFLSLDSRSLKSNPLYNAFKARSFTAGDITFHFYILDLLDDGEWYTINEILDNLNDSYLSNFETDQVFDESSVRKKLREYVKLGLIKSEKRGRELLYSREADGVDLATWSDAISFFSEENPLGVIGSYLLDKTECDNDVFRFKHHCILHSLDSQILSELLCAISEKRSVDITVKSGRDGAERIFKGYPVKIYISTQNGREYLLLYHYKYRKMIFFRLDTVISVKIGEFENAHEKYEHYYKNFVRHLWGVSTGIEYNIDHVEMTVRVDENEDFIVNRLLREKRCGQVDKIDDNTYKFSADVYDATELIPWVRTFVGRIVSFSCSNKTVEERFYNDLIDMSRMYLG